MGAILVGVVLKREFDGLCKYHVTFPKRKFEISWWLNGPSGDVFLHKIPFLVISFLGNDFQKRKFEILLWLNGPSGDTFLHNFLF
jgi:hypothetical protein